MAERIQARLKDFTGVEVDLGYLDSTFFRDDFRRRDSPVRANETRIDFLVEGKDVVLVDDVFYTGRSVRASLDAMIAFGRPAKVELLVLIERNYANHVPIKPDYIGKQVNTIDSQKVLVEWQGEGVEDDTIWLINTEE
jgi:pyrimidine operon attenuation protein/uracil phosphoribosyltransferase